MRQSVRSRRPWRMISCPAAKQIRWVKPSIATVSPSRTSSATASRIVATLLVIAALAGDLGAGLLEDRHGRVGLVLPEHQRRGHPDRVVAATEHQRTASERRLLHLVGGVVVLQADADHQAEPPNLLHDVV